MVTLEKRLKDSIKANADREMSKITRTALFLLESRVPAEEFVSLRKNLLDAMNNSMRQFGDFVDKSSITIK
jgi:hypothetical protein